MQRLFVPCYFPREDKIMQLVTLTNSIISTELFNQTITDYYDSDDTNSRPIPAVRTDAVYLYLL